MVECSQVFVLFNRQPKATPLQRDASNRRPRRLRLPVKQEDNGQTKTSDVSHAALAATHRTGNANVVNVGHTGELLN